MGLRLCPSCAHVNAWQAKFCSACGAALGTGAPRPLDEVEPGRRSIASPPVLPVSAALDGRAELNLTLRPLAEPAPEFGARARAALARPPSDRQEPPSQWPELIQSDPDPIIPVVDDVVVAPAPVEPVLPQPAPPQVVRGAAKAARRAAVRRARIATSPRRSGAIADSVDLLILDESEGARTELAALLEGFGFLVYPACGVLQAGALLAARPFAAVLLNIVFDGSNHSAGAALCQRVKSAHSPVAGRPPALIVIAERARSVDRVRAELAGADAFLVKPLVRGEVVRALEDCGIALPLDPRRG